MHQLFCVTVSLIVCVIRNLNMNKEKSKKQILRQTRYNETHTATTVAWFLREF